MGARIAWNNPLTVTGVVITSSSEATGYVDDNLANAARWKPWKSALATTDQWIKFDLGSSQSLQLFAAMDAVLHPGGTLRAQANATDVWTSPTINDLFTVPSTDYTHVLADWRSSVSSLRWVRFLFTNTGAVNSQVSLGAAFAGTYLEPARSVSSDLSFARVDPSVHRYAMGGQRSSLRRPKYHTVSGRFVLQTPSARNSLRQVYESIGSTTPAVITLDANDPSLTFYGTLQGTQQAQHVGRDLWAVPIDFVEDVA
jgi:hypothetical protein